MAGNGQESARRGGPDVAVRALAGRGRDARRYEAGRSGFLAAGQSVLRGVPSADQSLRGDYYTLGKLEILKLRADLEKKEGANFNLERFRDDLMQHGFAPITIVRREMLHDDSPVL